jgi:hypothetical protein
MAYNVAAKIMAGVKNNGGNENISVIMAASAAIE